MTNEEIAAQVAALERELAGYEAAGRADRADQVRAEIARLTGVPVAGADTSSRPSRKSATNRLAGRDKTSR